jgi:hypothetical protein
MRQVELRITSISKLPGLAVFVFTGVFFPDRGRGSTPAVEAAREELAFIFVLPGAARKFAWEAGRLPDTCDVGMNENSQGYNQSGRGYQLINGSAAGRIP